MTLIELKNNRALHGALMMVLAGAFFAGANTAVQYAGMVQGVPSPTIAFWQYAIAALAVTPLALRGAWRTNAPYWHFTRVGAAAIGVQLWVAGLASVPIWQAIALILSSPLFVTVGAVLLLQEKLTWPRAIAVLVGAIGGVIILAPWSEAFNLAAFLPVGAAAFWAGASLLTKRLSYREDAATLTVLLLLLLVPINGLAAIGTGFGLVGAAGGTVVAAGLLTVLAQLALARAYVVADAAFLQPFDHLKLPLNIGCGFLVFGFAPPGTMWMGAALMIGATAWLLRQEA